MDRDGHQSSLNRDNSGSCSTIGPVTKKRPGRSDRGRVASGDRGEDLDVGWHADPYGRFERRWWTGAAWSERVANGQQQALDPPGIVAAPFAGLEELPAAPIHDAHLPIAPPPASPTITWWIGLVVFIGLIILIVLSAISLS